ncbi:NAD(P)H-dependent oxidoreductase [Salinisphaera sp. P385]|uniref:NAD(P)H-dependent oxidoreductase n=1 Tax=Spectribacter acetivorans TaxID=3075603 RepID=A0ABU3B9Y7_9GAMM|nr:NAD(P)H-dependent oxidoreductase [Salinisphaera sp. P385]MDT0618978.1 NAD(P)H-dependent oxidoreductase [Salinisphaera sp. P385]
MSTDKQLLIIAHAPSGNTERLAGALAEGASDATIAGVSVQRAAPLQAGPDDVLAADAILLFTPENLGYMSGALKDFFDRTYYAVLDHKQGLPYALCVRAGSDGTGTCRAVDTITTGLRWRAVNEPLVCRGDFRDAFVDDCRELGMAMAAGLEAGVF